jgi:hypothetical protein
MSGEPEGTTLQCGWLSIPVPAFEVYLIAELNIYIITYPIFTTLY